MTGTLPGNIFGPIYFIYFQLAGIISAFLLLKKESTAAKLTVGSAFGSLCMQWLCALSAFIFGFNITGHMAAAACELPVFILGIRHKNLILKDFHNPKKAIKENALFLILLGAIFALWCNLLDSHIIPMDINGAVHTGQCTYGDMNMHLGFITSIANQSAFPPFYSIFPNTKLAYPFLNASISSSIYVFGASLQISYVLPMMAAFLQVCGGVYILADAVLKDKLKADFAWLLLFFNGGLGFIYFIGLGGETGLSVKDIFTGFYTTPTNLINHNIRWANIIADILLPQRASLFGYAILFSAIWLLYCAIWQGKDRYFIYAAVFAGALPLIHTHSFLAIGLISAAWLLLWLYRNTSPDHKWNSGLLLTVFVLFMCLMQYVSGKISLSSQFYFAVGITGICICILYGIGLMVKFISVNGYKKLLSGWGKYLFIVLIIALPQLLLWTFGQVAEGGFLRGHFNWGNLGDSYLWFYMKNIGLPIILIFAAIFKGGNTVSLMALPAGVIWFVAEFIMFTPNTYDNNKLLYVAYMMLCIVAADWGIDKYKKHKGAFSTVLACIFSFLCVISAVLTLGREVVSDYVLYSADHMKLVEYVENNTGKDAVFLTDTRHNNEIASLTGRNIVCGSDSFLYYHGIDTTRRKSEVAAMFRRPAENLHLFEKYDVDYVLISSYERANCRPDIYAFDSMFEKVFDHNGIVLYKI